MITFTKDDVSTNQKLESLLLRITNQLASMQRANDTRIAALQVRTETALNRLSTQASQLSGDISAMDGAFSRAFAQEPGAYAIYDEQENRWITTTDGSPLQEGLITTDSQSFAGDKTFQDDVIIGGDLTVQGDTDLQETTVNQNLNLDGNWRFTHSDSHLNVEYYDGADWGIKGTFIP